MEPYAPLYVWLQVTGGLGRSKIAPIMGEGVVEPPRPRGEGGVGWKGGSFVGALILAVFLEKIFSIFFIEKRANDHFFEPPQRADSKKKKQPLSSFGGGGGLVPVSVACRPSAP